MPISLTQKIIDDAYESAAEIGRAAAMRIESIHANSQHIISDRRDAAYAAAESEGKLLKIRMMRNAEHRRKMEMLVLKREMVDIVFDKALLLMQSMPVDQARCYAQEHIVCAAEGDDEVIIDIRDMAVYTTDFVYGVNQKLIENGKDGNLRLSNENRDIAGGFILRRGAMEIDCSYAAIIEQMRYALEKDVAEMLFY